MKIDFEFHNHWKHLKKELWYITFFEIDGSWDDVVKYFALTIFNFEIIIFARRKR